MYMNRLKKMLNHENVKKRFIAKPNDSYFRTHILDTYFDLQHHTGKTAAYIHTYNIIYIYHMKHVVYVSIWLYLFNTYIVPE